MYLFFNVNEYFFALKTLLVKRVDILNSVMVENEVISLDNTEYKIFEGKNFFNLFKGRENQKKNIIFVSTKSGYNYGIIVNTVDGFFDIENTQVINKTSLLNRYGYQYVDFAVEIDNKLIFVFYDDFFDIRYKELTCQK